MLLNFLLGNLKTTIILLSNNIFYLFFVRSPVEIVRRLQTYIILYVCLPPLFEKTHINGHSVAEFRFQCDCLSERKNRFFSGTKTKLCSSLYLCRAKVRFFNIIPIRASIYEGFFNVKSFYPIPS